jgi:DNA-binding transcriptional LysR family regulator
VAVAPSHPFARQKQVKLTQLAGEKLLAYSRAEYPEYHQMLGDMLTALKNKPRINEEHSSGTSLLAAAEVGRGLAIVPSCIAMLVTGRLVLRPLTPAPRPLQVGAVFVAEQLSPAAQKFVAAARMPVKK